MGRLVGLVGRLVGALVWFVWRTPVELLGWLVVDGLFGWLVGWFAGYRFVWFVHWLMVYLIY